MLESSRQIVVVGAGHAGCEAAFAAARLGVAVKLVTLRKDRVGWMSCNPAIGGMGKGHLVKEIDALGGLMAQCTDQTGIQFRTLNTRRGPAVRGSRVQVDRVAYAAAVRRRVEDHPGIDLVEAMVNELLLGPACEPAAAKPGARPVLGVRLEDGRTLRAAAVILTTGTFLNGVSHIGAQQASCGRAGDRAALRLSDSLAGAGLSLVRFKTGTTPRLDGRTIDYSGLERQDGDPQAGPFSIWTDRGHFPSLAQRACFITYTNPKTHQIIKENINKSAMFSGKIEGRGARYCPSIEDKITRFASRSSHTIFLEPDGLQSNEVYPAGLSTSLPEEVQLAMLRSMAGLESVEILRPGYAIEYDLVTPGQLQPSLVAKGFEGLYLAGQINGTSGYEEAAAQGLLAGWNAARAFLGKAPVSLGRDQAYLGVLVDDLCTQGTDEPYRMFTSRAEHRLALREDNADLRLLPLLRDSKLLSESQLQAVEARRARVETERARLEQAPSSERDSGGRLLSYASLLRRPGFGYGDLPKSEQRLGGRDALSVELDIRYEGYVEKVRRRTRDVLQMDRLEFRDGFVFEGLPGLSSELCEKLMQARPRTLGQASRIRGMTPVALDVLAVHLARLYGPSPRESSSRL